MTAVLSWDTRLLLLEHPYAVQSVACPKCSARPGEDCKSTGGGNYQTVTPHQARWARIANWTAEQLADAQTKVKAQGRTWWAHLPADYYAATELAAAPIVREEKPATPKGVRLSEIQAERIEQAAEHREGRDSSSTAHFHGDHQDRQTMNALEAKGIFRFVELTADGYDRLMELTAFGWQVYRQHRLIIRRMADSAAAEFEAKARDAEAQRAVQSPEPILAPVAVLADTRARRQS